MATRLMRGAALIACAMLLPSSPIGAAGQDSTELNPPPREKGKPSRPAPRYSPQNWVTDDDYPDAALIEHQEGTVGFTLDIGPDGQPIGCTTTSSSGFALLDDQACSLLRRRAKFHPALDAKGRPVAGDFKSRFTWILPDQDVPLASWSSVVRFDLTPAGTAKCAAEEFGTPQSLREDMCVASDAFSPAMVKAMLGQSDKVTLTLVEQHEVAGQPLPPGAPALSGNLIRRSRIAYTILPNGKVADCRNIDGNDSGRRSPYRCHPGFRYPAAAEGVQRSGVLTTFLTTTGEVPPFMKGVAAPAAAPAD